jgi:ubiquinone biosynthesis protein
MWTAAEPVAREWVEGNLGLAGRLRDLGSNAQDIGGLLMRSPDVLRRAATAASSLADMARTGLRLDDDTIERLAARQNGRTLYWQAALWVGALSLLALALRQYGYL